MVDLGFYEKVVPASGKRKTLLRRALIIIGYILALLVWIGSAYSGEISPALILLVALAISGVAFLLLRRSDAEYEYSISESSVTLAKIYGKSKRKELFCAEADSILYIAPHNEINMKKAEDYRPAETYDVHPEGAQTDLWLMVFENEKEENILFIFEAEGEATKLLRKLKPSAVTFR